MSGTYFASLFSWRTSGPEYVDITTLRLDETTIASMIAMQLHGELREVGIMADSDDAVTSVLRFVLDCAKSCDLQS